MIGVPTPRQVVRRSYERAIGSRVSDHALKRCVEMGVSPAALASLMHDPSLTWDSYDETTVRVSDAQPRWAVVVGDDGTVVTVVFRTDKDYVRDGRTFTIA